VSDKGGLEPASRVEVEGITTIGFHFTTAWASISTRQSRICIAAVDFSWSGSESTFTHIIKNGRGGFDLSSLCRTSSITGKGKRS